MNTEQKIKEAFEMAVIDNLGPAALCGGKMSIYEAGEIMFRAGYLALLNSLEPTGVFARNKEREQVMTYRLPEGVTKP